MQLNQKPEWEVGQTVIEHSGGVMDISKIKKITKISSKWGGTIYVGTNAYDMLGYGRGGSKWSTPHIVPATPETTKVALAEKARSFFSRVAWEKLTDDQALALRRLFDEVLEKPHSEKDHLSQDPA